MSSSYYLENPRIQVSSKNEIYKIRLGLSTFESKRNQQTKVKINKRLKHTIRRCIAATVSRAIFISAVKCRIIETVQHEHTVQQWQC